MSAPILYPGDHVHIQVAISPSESRFGEAAEAALRSMIEIYNNLGVYIPAHTITNAPGAETKIVAIFRKKENENV